MAINAQTDGWGFPRGTIETIERTTLAGGIAGIVTGVQTAALMALTQTTPSEAVTLIGYEIVVGLYAAFRSDLDVTTIFGGIVGGLVSAAATALNATDLDNSLMHGARWGLIGGFAVGLGVGLIGRSMRNDPVPAPLPLEEQEALLNELDNELPELPV